MYLLKAGSTSIHLSFLLQENRNRVKVTNTRGCKKVALNFLVRQPGSGFINLKLIVEVKLTLMDSPISAFFICCVNVERNIDIHNGREINFS